MFILGNNFVNTSALGCRFADLLTRYSPVHTALLPQTTHFFPSTNPPTHNTLLTHRIITLLPFSSVPRGIFVSNHTILCLAPSTVGHTVWNGANTADDAEPSSSSPSLSKGVAGGGVVTVEVTVNGIDYTNSQVTTL